MSSVADTSTSTVPTRELTRTVAPSASAAGREVVGVHEQVVAWPAPREPLDVVHPGVAVLLVAAADEQQLALDRGRDGGEPGQVVEHQRRGQVDAVVAGLEALGQQPGAQRPRSMPAGWARSLRSVTPVRPLRSRSWTSRVGLAVIRARSASRLRREGWRSRRATVRSASSR